MCLYQFLFRQTWSRNPFLSATPILIISSRLFHRSRRISNSKQSSDEIKFYWSRDCNQNKTVCYTGTTQPKTEPSGEGVKFCRWLFCGGGKRLIYTIFAYAKESINWLTGTFWAYCNVLPVFGFNSAKYYIILIKSFFLPILVNERNIEPTVIKKAIQFVSFKFGDIQLLEIMNFLGGATSLDSFLKAHRTKETKGFLPYEWFDCPEKMNNKKLPPWDSFFSILRSSNPLEKEYNYFQILVNSGLTTEQALAKSRMDRIPPIGAENCSFLQSFCENNNMQKFSGFLKWYNNKDLVPTLEAMQKMIEFYHNKGIDMLKLRCTLPNLANICLHKSTDSKFYPCTESDKDLLEKIREIMVGGLLLSLHVKL